MNSENILNSTEQTPVIPVQQEEVTPIEGELLPTVSDKEEGDSYGKFKTALELKNAYEKLEQEFTRKSQKLKELEGKLAERAEDAKWTERVKAFQEAYPVSKALGAEITTYLKENKGLIRDENCLESALLHVLATKFEEKKSRSTQEVGSTSQRTDNAPRVISSGAISVAPRREPTTVKEANALATERLKQYKPN